MITYFKTIYNNATPYHLDISDAFKRIKNGVSKSIIDKIRKEADKDKRNILKKTLPAICFSGEFSERKANALISHSGYVCLDFDGLEDIHTQKRGIVQNRHVYACFISPSGNGLKVVVRIPPEAENQASYYDALANEFKNVDADRACKDVARVCYESYDPDIYINDQSEIWEGQYTEVETTRFNAAESVPLTDEGKVIDNLRVWIDNKYPVMEGQRNESVFKFAKACNEYGVNKSHCEYYCISNWSTKGFTQNEVKTTVKSAYSDTAIHGAKQFEDKETLSTAKQLIRGKKSDQEITEVLKSKGIDDGVIIEAIDKAKEQTSGNLTKFWSIDKRGRFELLRNDYRYFLKQHGFYRYAVGNSYIFIRVINNVVQPVETYDIKTYVLAYIEEHHNLDVYEFMTKNIRGFFHRDLLEIIDMYNHHQHKSTHNEAYFYFKNGVLKVTKDNKELIDYFDLSGFVWDSHIINRDYITAEGEAEFYKFIGFITLQDHNKIMAFMSVIGYLLHDYKHTKSPAIILNDEKISDNPEGGTGKGLFMKGVTQFKRGVTIDGKAMKMDSSFCWQRVNIDTQVLIIEDIVKGFSFERLFSIITDGIAVEKKGAQEFYLDFENSPKICITTNYAIKGQGGSNDRRKHELEFSDYFHVDHSPFEEFGHSMFLDWTDAEWTLFDNFMVQCAELYLVHGLVKHDYTNLDEKRLNSDTSHEFASWIGDNIKLGDRFGVKGLKEQFTTEFPLRKKWTTPQVWKQNLMRWADYKKYDLSFVKTNGVEFGEYNLNKKS